MTPSSLEPKATSDHPTVLVTGATGGLGVHLVRTLSQVGWQVRGLDRVPIEQTGRAGLVGDAENVEWHIQSHDGGQGDDAIRGCQAVVHAASIASLSGPSQDLQSVNLDFSRELYTRAAAQGVEHFVHISCASVYRTESGVRTEDSPTEAYNDFEQSKLDAELELNRLREHLDGGPALTILRPALLYGPGCTSMGAGLIPIPAILRGISRYLPGLTGGPRTNWCHVADAASAVELVLSNEQARDQIFNIADETPLSFGEVLTSIIQGYGIDLGPSVRMPHVAIWTLLGPLLDADWSLEKMRDLLQFLWRRIQGGHGIESPLVPRLNRDALLYLRDDTIVVADALRSLGWEPQWPDYRQGIAHTIRWYQRQRWVPRFDFDALNRQRDSRGATTRFEHGEDIDGFLLRERKDRGPAQLSMTLSWPMVPHPPINHEGVLRGTFSATGLAHNASVEGTVRLRWFPTVQIDYEFGFRNLDDEACRFEGQRQFDLSSPLASLRRLEGRFVDQYGHTIGDFQGQLNCDFRAHLTDHTESSSP